MSPYVPCRPIGMPAVMMRGSVSIGMPSVGVWSGAIVFTRMPSGASSSASVREKLVTAPFMPAYTAYPGAARWPSIDVMLMMLPP